MVPLIFNLGPTELIIILVIVLLLFGGSRLAGLGKSTGRALKEFKEETKGLRDKDEHGTAPPAGANPYQAPTDQAPQIAPYPPQQNGYGQPQQNGYGQPQQNGYGQPQNDAGQPSAQNAYPQAPGNAEQPADRDLRRDV